MTRPRTHRATSPRPPCSPQVIHPVALHRKAGTADKFFSFFTVALTTGAALTPQQRIQNR